MGKKNKILSPDRIKHNYTKGIFFMLRPFRALAVVIFNPGRCPGLVCYTLSGLRI